MSEDKKSSTFIRKHIDKSSLSFNQNVINYDEKYKIVNTYSVGM